MYEEYLCVLKSMKMVWAWGNI